MSTRVYVGCSNAFPALENSIFYPIFLQNISEKFDCPFLQKECLGAVRYLLWIWKYTSSSKIGFMRDNRYLSMIDKKVSRDVFCEFSSGILSKYGWNSESATSYVENIDLFVPKKYSLKDIIRSQGVETVLDFYICEGGFKKDIDITLSFIRKRFPDLYPYIMNVLYSGYINPWNLFISNRNVFNSYCDILYGVLGELENNNSLSLRASCQRNTWELLAEIIFSAYVSLLSEQSNLVIKESEEIVFRDPYEYSIDRQDIVSGVCTDKNIIPRDVYYGNNVNIVLSFDDNYIKQACSTINSVIFNTGNPENIIFYVLHGDSLTKNSIEWLLSTYKNVVRLNFLKVSDGFVSSFPLNRSHITISSYYRLLIHNVIPKDVERVIYLDTDITVCDNIVELWNYDIGDNIIGGCQDENGLVWGWNIFRDKINASSYINAGIILFNIRKAREKYNNLDFLYINSFYNYKERICLQDQDILNIAYHEDIHILPLRWNVGASLYYCQSGHSEGGLEGREHVFSYKEKRKAVVNPSIVHFTGRQKPWKMNSMHPLKPIYWYYYKKTPGIKLSLKDKICSFNKYISIRSNGIYLLLNKKRYFISFGKK